MDSRTTLRVTSIQLEITGRAKEETVAHVLALLDAARGSELILLPELWPCGYFAFARYAAESEPLDGPTVQTLRRKAKDLGAYVFMGSFVERDGDRLYNTSLLLDDRGEIVARYRKIHLFGYDSDERRLLTRGEECVVAPTPWGKAGLSICYDLRFPELYRRLIDQGAELLLLSAAWPAPRIATWTLLARARAIENQAFLFACNGAGTNVGVRLGGRSLFVGPTGDVIAEAGDGEEVLSALVNPSDLRAARSTFPALADRIAIAPS